MAKLSVSVLSVIDDKKEIIEEINNSDVDYFHIDVMDGKFVKNKAFTLSEIKNASKLMTKPLDVHLMVKNPKKYIKELASYNVEYITFHYELEKNLDELIDLVHACGLKCGLSIKPKTNVESLITYLNKIDLVLVMSVEPGYGGQEFIPESLDKVKHLKTIAPNITIAIDGGINPSNAWLSKQAGVDILVIGSYLTNGNYQDNLKQLKTHL